MKTIEELKSSWESIHPAINRYILIETEHPLEFHIGFSSDGQMCFIVNDTGMIDYLKSSKAISIQCGRYIGDAYSLRFTLMQRKMEDLFIKLCWNLIDASQGESTDAVQRLTQEYINWQRLLQALGSQGLSTAQQKGLMAELLYLSEMITTVGPDEALASWVGPEASDQDFIFKNSWAEVKATSISSDKVSISSLQQLDRYDDGKLIVFRMDKTTARGANCITLMEVIDHINAQLQNQHQRDIFECKLIKCGLLSGDYYRHSDRFNITNETEYYVSSDFPRLTPSTAPASIVEAKYSISLSSATPFMREESQWQWK